MVVQVGTSYQHVKVGQWTNDVIEHSMKRLTTLAKPFKYIGMTICFPPLVVLTAVFLQLPV
jgi:hypothetical protein